MEDNNTHRLPEGFHPFTCMGAIRGLTDAIHHYMNQGPGSRHNPGRADQGSLVALIDLLRQHVHQIHAWLIELENSATCELPVTAADFEALKEKHDDDDEKEDSTTRRVSPIRS